MPLLPQGTDQPLTTKCGPLQRVLGNTWQRNDLLLIHYYLGSGVCRLETTSFLLLCNVKGFQYPIKIKSIPSLTLFQLSAQYTLYHLSSEVKSGVEGELLDTYTLATLVLPPLYTTIPLLALRFFFSPPFPSFVASRFAPPPPPPPSFFSLFETESNGTWYT